MVISRITKVILKNCKKIGKMTHLTVKNGIKKKNLKNFYFLKIKVPKYHISRWKKLLINATKLNRHPIYPSPSEGSVVYQMSNGYKVLKSSRLGLDCVCDSCLSTDTLSYQWSVYMEDYRSVLYIVNHIHTLSISK